LSCSKFRAADRPPRARAAARAEPTRQFGDVWHERVVGTAVFGATRILYMVFQMGAGRGPQDGGPRPALPGRIITLSRR
jgi:hypothetical protein